MPFVRYQLCQFIARMNARAPEWIVARFGDEPGAHGVRQNVSNDVRRRFLIAQHALVVPLCRAASLAALTGRVQVPTMENFPFDHLA